MHIVRPIVLALLLVFAGLALAQGMGDAGTASVTLHNTSSQAISPPVVIVHESGYAPFSVGAAAPPELVLLAEDGDASELAIVARVAPGVHGVTVAEGPLPPGERVTLEVPVAADTPYLTVLGMLVTTNDAFAHVTIDVREAAMMDGGMAGDDMSGDGMGDGMAGDAMGEGDMAMAGHAPPHDGVVRVYDAGSEHDTEACAHIPGPPCGNPGVRVEEGAEGHVALDGGILGVGDLDPAEWDWRNPVLEVQVELAN
jgi:hypothetical protein